VALKDVNEAMALPMCLMARSAIAGTIHMLLVLFYFTFDESCS